ncbi:MAG: ImmA/IrrE family metallo-endopeptidase [Clostridiales bacterium]|nr:ImmA/IrrE family metallo-endopeptidase [Clostridiales bacterium]
MLRADEAVAAADKLYKRFKTRNADELVELLGITVYNCPFVKQKGVYTVIERNPYVYINESLDPKMRSIVLLHEIGHHILHRREAMRIGGFCEFDIFAIQKNRMEYEANTFAAQISLPDDEILEYIMRGDDVEKIALAMNSDANLVALKVEHLNKLGYEFRAQEHRSDFLK